MSSPRQSAPPSGQASPQQSGQNTRPLNEPYPGYYAAAAPLNQPYPGYNPYPAQAHPAQQNVSQPVQAQTVAASQAQPRLSPEEEQARLQAQKEAERKRAEDAAAAAAAEEAARIAAQEAKEAARIAAQEAKEAANRSKLMLSTPPPCIIIRHRLHQCRCRQAPPRPVRGRKPTAINAVALQVRSPHVTSLVVHATNVIGCCLPKSSAKCPSEQCKCVRQRPSEMQACLQCVSCGCAVCRRSSRMTCLLRSQVLAHYTTACEPSYKISHVTTTSHSVSYSGTQVSLSQQHAPEGQYW